MVYPRLNSNSVREIKRNMDYWDSLVTGSCSSPGEFSHAQHLDIKLTNYLRVQPPIITKDFKLKQYQLTGVSWMLMLYDKNLGGILADEMVTSVAQNLQTGARENCAGRIISWNST